MQFKYSSNIFIQWVFSIVNVLCVNYLSKCRVKCLTNICKCIHQFVFFCQWFIEFSTSLCVPYYFLFFFCSSVANFSPLWWRIPFFLWQKHIICFQSIHMFKKYIFQLLITPSFIWLMGNATLSHARCSITIRKKEVHKQ